MALRNDDSLALGASTKSGGGPPVAKSSWDDTPSVSNPDPFAHQSSRRRGGDEATSMTGKATETSTRMDSDNEKDDIPSIPSLEDATKEPGGGPIDTSIAEAPRIRPATITNVGQLQAAAVKFQFRDSADLGIDLTLLTEALPTLTALHEDSGTWSWSSLFRDVSLEMQAEAARSEVHEATKEENEAQSQII